MRTMYDDIRARYGVACPQAATTDPDFPQPRPLYRDTGVDGAREHAVWCLERCAHAENREDIQRRLDAA